MMPDGELGLFDMRFHVLSLPHTQTTLEYSACAYTTKARRFCDMMSSLGHEVFLYASEENDADCVELITVASKEDQLRWFGNNDFHQKFFNITWDMSHEHWQVTNARTIEEINKRLQPQDFVCILGGVCQQQVGLAFPDNPVVEYGIGYSGVFANFKVFESYAHMHFMYGRMDDDNGKFYDCVIPNYFDPDEFKFSAEKEDYYVFLGRYIQRKGPEIAVEATRRLGAKLVMAGQGATQEGNTVRSEEGWSLSGDHIEHIGHVNVEQRAELLSKAKGVFMPTTYLEPFGGVSIEALFCGTPVIATDFGVFCVPTSAEILTRQGWKRHDQVEKGDETLGYAGNGQLEWTPIEAVNVFPQQQTTTYRNRNWGIRVTGGHKWVMRQAPDGYRNTPAGPEYLESFENVGSNKKIQAVLAGLAPSGSLDIAPAEAALIGWLMTDGTMEGSYKLKKYHGRTLYDWEQDDPTLVAAAKIAQAKPGGLEALHEVLEHFPYSVTDRGKTKDHHHNKWDFRIKISAVRDILNRARIYETGLDVFLLNLTKEARSAFLAACFDAEGWHASAGSTKQLSQNMGPVLDAMALSVYLEGNRPTLQKAQITNGVSNVTIGICNPVIRPGCLHVEEGMIEDVWCPSTGLGTWTMRFDGHITLTGNTETIPHGKVGFRFRTIGEAVYGASRVGELDPYEIRQYAESNFSTERVKYLYNDYFEQVLTLWDFKVAEDGSSRSGFYADWHGLPDRYERFI
jgi:hypothetical protein